MPVTTNQIDVHAYASAVMTALTDLQGYLTAAFSPDRMALADLEMEPMGWTRRAYSEKAFQIWQKQLELFPDDPLILHHMAIMHHARAFDIENGRKPAKSDADWESAMDCWYRLYKTDAFWDKLTAKACAGTVRQDVVRKLREDFPQMIMAIHYDIALDKETREKRKSRAKFHIGVVHKAPFAAHERVEAQRAAYNRFIQIVPDEVWQPNELREEVLAKGQQAIVEYLNYDPGCVPALEDALRLQRRVQRSRNTAWRALDKDDPQRNTILHLEKKDAQTWRPFFDQLVTVAEELDGDVREDLARWYHGRGSDLRALDEHEEAIEFYRRAVEVCHPDDDERKLHVRELVQTLAHVARAKAANHEAGAKAYCKKVRERADLTMIACWLLAQAYAHLKSFDVAEEMCDRGLAIEPDFDDLEADEWAQRLAEFKQEISIIGQLSAATEAMEAGRFQAALPSLDQAEQLANAADRIREHKRIYWLRTQAYLGLERVDDAKRDADLYNGLLDEASSPADIEAGQRLYELIENSCIKPLLERAKQAMEGGRFQDALTPLNEAARRSPGTDVIFFLRAQAHAALGNIADAKRDARKVGDLAETAQDRKRVKELNKTIDEMESASLVKDLLDQAKSALENGSYRQAVQSLDQAAGLAPKTSVIYFLRAQAHMALGNVTAARRDARKVSNLAEAAQDRERARRLGEMIDEAESASRIKDLLDQAKSALENGRYRQAVQSLDQAAGLAPNVSVIYFLRAQAHMALGDVTDARRDAGRVADLAETAQDREHARNLHNMIDRAASTSAVKDLLDEAKSAMESQRFGQAAQILDEAARLAPDLFWVYFLRAQARMGSHDLPGAIQDVQMLDGLASSTEERTAADQLKDAFFRGMR